MNYREFVQVSVDERIAVLTKAYLASGKKIAHANGSTTLIRNVSRLNEDYRIAYEPFTFEL